MTYDEITLFLESLFISQGPDAKLNLRQLMHYRLSIENCPLLAELLNYYLPYARKTQHLIWDALLRYREEDAELLDVHDPALAGPRLLAKSWLSKNYPQNDLSTEEKARAIQQLLIEIKTRVSQGLHDSSLLLQYKQCQLELDAQQRRREQYLQDPTSCSNQSQTINEIRTDFMMYIDELISEMVHQTAGVNEMLSIKCWIDSCSENEGEIIDATPLRKKSDRWGLLVETIDESRTAYIAGGSFAGKQRSCPIGFEERILDRIALLIQALDATEESTVEKMLVKHLVSPFVEYDFESKSFQPTQRLYECYLHAASYDIVAVECPSWSLYVSPEEALYQQLCGKFIEKEVATIRAKMEEYLEKVSAPIGCLQDMAARVELNKIQAQLRPYTRSRQVNEDLEVIELCSEEQIAETLKAVFADKITRIEQDTDYLASLSEQEQQLFRPLLSVHTNLVYKIQRQQGYSLESLVEESDSHIVANMAQNIGFGPEHVRLLLAIIGQSRATVETAGNRARQGGMELLEKYALEEKSLHGAALWGEAEKEQWRVEATALYWDYIQKHVSTTGQEPFVCVLPDSFNRTWLNESLHKYFLNPKKYLPASNSLVARLYRQGDLLLPTLESKKHFFKLGVASGAAYLVAALTAQGLLAQVSDQVLHSYVIAAVKNGHLGVLEVLLSFSESCLDRADSDNYCADMLMTEAVSNGYADVADLLVRKGADLSFTDNDKKDLLMCAAENGHLAVIQILLIYNPQWDLNHKDNYLRTALMCAAAQGHKTVVRYLLRKKVDISCQDLYQRNAILIAAEFGQLEVLQILLQFYPELNLNVRNKFGHTPLIIAALRGHLPVVALLLQKRTYQGSRDNTGRNALSAAACTGQLDVLKLLLTQDYFIRNIDSKDSSNMTAIMHAANRGHYDVAEFLLEKGANCDIFSHEKENALFFAIGYEHSNSFLKKALESKSCSKKLINTATRSGTTCLKKAIEFQDVEKIELFLSHGAFWRPVHTASQRPEAASEYLQALRCHDFKRLWKLAQSYRANSEALALAVLDGNSAAVNLLLSIGTPLPEVTDGQENILMSAVKLGYKNTVLCLLPYMADYLDYHNEDGLSAAQIADFYGHTEIALLIAQFQKEQEVLPNPPELLLLSNTPISLRKRSLSI